MIFLRERNASIFVALSLSNDNLFAFEIDVLDAQSTCVHETQPRASSFRLEEGSNRNRFRTSSSNLGWPRFLAAVELATVSSYAPSFCIIRNFILNNSVEKPTKGSIYQGFSRNCEATGLEAFQNYAERGIIRTVLDDNSPTFQ